MRSRSRTWFLSAAVTAAAIASSAAPSRADAQMLTFLGTSTMQGGGLGNVATVLTLQNPGGSTNSTGCVGPAGFTGCGFTDANVQQGQSQVRAVSAFPGITGNTFQLYLNAVEPGNDNAFTLNNLVVTLYGSNNQTWSATFGSRTFTDAQTGVGNFGYLFGLAEADQAAFDAFIAANPNAVIGAGASFSNVQGGPETISIGRRQGNVTVPEPSSLALLAAGAASLLLRRRTRVG